MSEHTKGELKVTPIKTIAFVITGKQFAVLTKGGLSEKELQDRAIRFVKCWNSHDDLLAALEEIKGLTANVGTDPRFLLKMIEESTEQALAKAKL